MLNLPAIAEYDEDIPIAAESHYSRKAGDPLHADYESRETLERLRREMGTEIFAAQYQQCPVPEGGAMLRREWFRYYDALPERDFKVKIVQSWDTASKSGAQNDWSVCTTWFVVNKRDYYLLDVTRGRYEYPQLKATAMALAEKYMPTTILIEDASTGIALAQELRQLGRYKVKPVPVEHDKRTRLYVQTSRFEAGQVHFPRRAAFLADLEAELLSFPQGRTDDQVDSISQALAWKISGYDSSLSWVS